MMKKTKTIKEIRDSIDAEEHNERLDTVSSLKLDIDVDTQKTERIKNEFINSMLNEYDAEFKENPNSAKIIDDSFGTKIKNVIVNFFNRF